MGTCRGVMVLLALPALQDFFSKAPDPKSMQPQEKDHIHSELGSVLGNTTKKWKGYKQVLLVAVGLQQAHSLCLFSPRSQQRRPPAAHSLIHWAPSPQPSPFSPSSLYHPSSREGQCWMFRRCNKAKAPAAQVSLGTRIFRRQK